MKTDKKNIKVLYLARWYPHRYDPMFGLFVQRHAEAAARFCRVGVVYTHIVEGEKIKGFETDFSFTNGVPVARVYYNSPEKTFPLFRFIKYFRASAAGIRKIKQELGGFDVIHVHILTRPGIIALWYKWFHRKPYLISEHWSRYLPLTGQYKGAFRKWITRLVVKNASLVTTVTQNLANAMQSHGLKNRNYQVLANVVADDFSDFPLKKMPQKEKTTFLHVSCFDDKPKNISGLLRVIKSLKNKRDDFLFKMIGDGMDLENLKEFAGELGLNEKTVVFTGLLEGKKLVEEMASGDLLVVFSHYENFPVVINECFVLGIPVIATRVGGIPEFVNESNGRLVDAGDEKALEEYLNDYLDGKFSFDKQKISENYRHAFSSETIGRKLCGIYKKILLVGTPTMGEGKKKN